MKKNILLVEYDGDTIDTIKGALQHEMLDIAVTADAPAAHALLKKRTFDLVITEALLPKSHGSTLCEHIFKHFPNTKVIVISEKVKGTDERRGAFRCGAAEFFEKPLDPVKFRKKIIKLLNIRERTEDSGVPVGDTTNLYVIPIMDELRSEEDKEKDEKDKEKAKDKDTTSGTDKFKNILEDMKESDSYEIDLE
jgi:DNA-binding NtrC family response regulator